MKKHKKKVKYLFVQFNVQIISVPYSVYFHNIILRFSGIFSYILFKIVVGKFCRIYVNNFNLKFVFAFIYN